MFSPQDPVHYLKLPWIAGALLVACYAIRIRATRARKVLPPGPPGWPLIGNVLQWPTKDRWLTWVEWAQEYGDMVYANIVGTNIIIVNSRTTAYQLFEVQGANFSDRASMFFLYEMVGWKDAPVLQNMSPAQTAQRKILLREIGLKQHMAAFEDTMRYATLKCLRDMKDDSDRLPDHIRLLNGTTIMMIAYGYKVETSDDKFVSMAEDAFAELARTAIPGTFLVDALPFLRFVPSWIPGAGFQKVAQKMSRSRKRVLDEPYEYTVGELAAGRARPSFVGSRIAAKDQDLTSEEVLNIKWAANQIYLAGGDTTGSAMRTFIQCMLLNSEVQRKAQAELDTVVGRERLPTLADRPRLPYLEACIKESLRWGPATPEGLPHVARADAHYGGHYIPKGTIMIANVWGMAHDPEIYHEPFVFHPERFLGSNPAPDPVYVFGFGRRVCVGQHLAFTSIYVLASTMLALFNIERSRGPDGKDLEVPIEYEGEGIVFPVAFPFCCSPRSDKAAQLFTTALDSVL